MTSIGGGVAAAAIVATLMQPPARVAGVDYSSHMQEGPIPTAKELLNYRLTYEDVLYVRLPSYNNNSQLLHWIRQVSTG